jgi:hypothetical protein
MQASGPSIASLKIQSTTLPATHSNPPVLPQAVECCLKLKTTYVFKVPDLNNEKNVHEANSNASRKISQGTLTNETTGG